MKKVLQTLKQLLARIDELTLRERAIVFAGVLSLLTLGWYGYLIEPLIKEEKKLMAELSTKQAQINTLNEQFIAVSQRQGQDQNKINREKLDRLQRQLEATKQEVAEATAHLVTPELMPEILQTVLNKSQGLTMMKLHGLGSEPLLAATAVDVKNDEQVVTANTDGDMGAAYKHGVQIVITGNFLQTLSYMRKLETLPWEFFWDSIKFEVDQYPQAVTSITFYTLSLDKNWISI